MVALIELRPVRVAQRIEGGERLVGLAVRLLHPGPRQDRRQIGNRALTRRGEVLVGFLVVAALERVAAEQELRDAVRRLDLDQLARELDGAIPIGSRRFKQEGLLEYQLVAWVLGERPRIEIGRGRGVVVAAGHATGEIVAEQSAGLGTVGYRRRHFRIGRRSSENGQGKERPPRPFAEDRVFGSWHVRSAWRRPKQCGSKAPQCGFKGPHSAVQRPLKGEDYAFSRCPQPKSLLAPERRRVCDRFPRQAYTEAESGGVTYFTCLRNWARPRLQEAPR